MNRFVYLLILFLTLIGFSTIPVRPDSGRPPDLKDIHYGTNQLQTFDLWKGESGGKCPAVIYFHGGRFTGGDKNHGADRLIDHLPDRGISVISANYRLVNEKTFFPRPHKDAARVVQFVRLNSEQFNINPDRIAVAGTSAGGSIALWLGLHSEMSKSNSPNPLKRQSTRVSCVLAYNGQTTLDPRFIFEHLIPSTKVFRTTAGFFGVTANEMLSPSPKLQHKIDEVSPLTHVTQDDPPVFLVYDTTMTAFPVPPDSTIDVAHHPAFGIFLQDIMTPLNLEISLYWKNGGISNKPMPRDADIDFVVKKLKKRTTN